MNKDSLERTVCLALKVTFQKGSDHNFSSSLGSDPKHCNVILPGTGFCPVQCIVLAQLDSIADYWVLRDLWGSGTLYSDDQTGRANKDKRLHQVDSGAFGHFGHQIGPEFLRSQLWQTNAEEAAREKSFESIAPSHVFKALLLTRFKGHKQNFETVQGRSSGDGGGWGSV